MWLTGHNTSCTVTIIDTDISNNCIRVQLIIGARYGIEIHLSNEHDKTENEIFLLQIHSKLYFHSNIKYYL